MSIHLPELGHPSAGQNRTAGSMSRKKAMRNKNHGKTLIVDSVSEWIIFPPERREMPNRIIKETIRTDKKLNYLNDFQFRLWLYLITYVDDYGRGYAETDILKGNVFPRRKTVTEKDIENGLAVLEEIGLIKLYKVDGELFFYFPSWAKHQRIQTKRSTFPAPDESNEESSSTVFYRDPPPESDVNMCSERSSNPTDPEADCEAIQLNDGSEWRPSEKDFAEYERLYPAVDVRQEISKMRGWSASNPTKRKTAKGIKRFVTNWLSRAQDSYGNKKSRATDAHEAFMDRWENA